MSDKELEEYINKIEPNFNSHLEKGTIEMSNEYYNLLEEKMVRLINKNQELKERINKSLDYIGSNYIEVLKYHDIPSETTSYEIVTVDLLKILKGGEMNNIKFTISMKKRGK